MELSINREFCFRVTKIGESTFEDINQKHCLERESKHVEECTVEMEPCSIRKNQITKGNFEML